MGALSLLTHLEALKVVSGRVGCGPHDGVMARRIIFPVCGQPRSPLKSFNSRTLVSNEIRLALPSFRCAGERHRGTVEDFSFQFFFFLGNCRYCVAPADAQFVMLQFRGFGCSQQRRVVGLTKAPTALLCMAVYNWGGKVCSQHCDK